MRGGYMDDLDPNPESTWGASAEYRAAWEAKYGAKAPAPQAPQAAPADPAPNKRDTDK